MSNSISTNKISTDTTVPASDLDVAVSLLFSGDFTCVLVKNGNKYTSSLKGIAPMLGFIEAGLELDGSSVADRVVGKAAALLFCYAGVINVYAEVLSQGGKEILEKFNVNFTHKKLVPHIQNRTNTGLCPMEQTVKQISTPAEALPLLKAKLAQLMGKRC